MKPAILSKESAKKRQRLPLIGGGFRLTSGESGRHILAAQVSPGHTSVWWTQAERDAFVAGGIRPEQPSLFDVVLP